MFYHKNSPCVNAVNPLVPADSVVSMIRWKMIYYTWEIMEFFFPKILKREKRNNLFYAIFNFPLNELIEKAQTTGSMINWIGKLCNDLLMDLLNVALLDSIVSLMLIKGRLSNEVSELRILSVVRASINSHLYTVGRACCRNGESDDVNTLWKS